MANRSEAEMAGRGYLGQPQALVELGRQEDGDNDAIGGPTEVRSGSSAWEQMLDALTSDDDAGTRHDGGSLRASIAERLHTRGGSPTNENPGEAPEVRPVRRRRRPL